MIFRRACLAVVAAVAALFAVQPAFACSCLARTAEQILQDAGVVFTGTAREVEPSGDMGVQVRFDVEEVWKGEVGDSVGVGTVNNSAACGVEFRTGRRYIVAAHAEAGALSTNLCTMIPFLDPPDPEAVLAVLRAYRDGGGVGHGTPWPASFAGLTEANFDYSGGDLSDVSFAGAQLSDGKLAGARLQGARFAGADVRAVTFGGADLRRAQFAGATIPTAISAPPT